MDAVRRPGILVSVKEMTSRRKPTHEMPGGEIEETEDNGVVNDSLGTVDSADSTGTDEEKDSGDAKENSRNTRED